MTDDKHLGSALREDRMSRRSRISRRDALFRGSSALAALAIFDSPVFTCGQKGEQNIPWIDQHPPPPKDIAEQMGTDMNLLDWQSLDSWITPNRKFFRANHYRTPAVNAESWKLEIGGLVDKPRFYSLNKIKALPKKDVGLRYGVFREQRFSLVRGRSGKRPVERNAARTSAGGGRFEGRRDRGGVLRNG
jgi:hypothetical protein